MSSHSTSVFSGLRLTRITNACVLIELGELAVLTDPWFCNPWGFNEEPGLQVDELPQLTAIIGSHFAPDHWGINQLQTYKYRDNTPTYTATKAMAKKAMKAGFLSAEHLLWREKREIAPGITLEVVEAQTSFGKPSNNYILSNSKTRIFFGGETKRLEPLTTYRASNPPVDVVIAPSNGMRLLGYQLVTTAEQALDAAKILGAHTLVPIHDSMHSIGFGGPTSSAKDLQGRAQGSPKILFLEAGKRIGISPEIV